MKRLFNALAGILSNACSSIGKFLAFVIDTLVSDSQELQRQQQEQMVRQQQLIKLLPYRLGLENRQLQELEVNLENVSQAVVTLTQQQCTQISEYIIRQMVDTDSPYTLYLRNLFLGAGIDVNLSYLRELHQVLYIDVLQNITEIDYQSATPTGEMFAMSSGSYLLIYDIRVKNEAQQKDYSTALQRYVNTQAGQVIVRDMGLKSAEVTCVFDSKLAIAIH